MCTATLTGHRYALEPHLAAVLARGNDSQARTTVRPDQDHVSSKNRAEKKRSQYEIVPACAPESSDEATDGRDFEGVMDASCDREAGSPIYRDLATTKGSS